jgi:hypothetical protein
VVELFINPGENHELQGIGFVRQSHTYLEFFAMSGFPEKACKGDLRRTSPRGGQGGLIFRMQLECGQTIAYLVPSRSPNSKYHGQPPAFEIAHRNHFFHPLPHPLWLINIDLSHHNQGSKRVQGNQPPSTTACAHDSSNLSTKLLTPFPDCIGREMISEGVG